MKSVLLTLLGICCVAAAVSAQPVEIAPGVYRLKVGEPDALTPFEVLHPDARIEAMRRLGEAAYPFAEGELLLEATERGCRVEVPLGEGEQLYGFGLQIETFGQRGLRKRPVVNDNPCGGLGLTHAPQPFYVSSRGYGILVNTARYTTFLCGTNGRLRHATAEAAREGVATTTEELYANRASGDGVHIDIPGAKGVELLVITGPKLREVVQRYNLLSGGGCLPPLWGLGFKYRVKGDAVQDTVMRFARYFRRTGIPCDVLGLEPGWHTAAYSCSYRWSDRFPRHEEMIRSLGEQGYRVNLWEHAYVHPSAPFYEAMKPYAGDYPVWGGLVPDFTQPEARRLFTEHHAGLMAEGVSGFKLDECDNSNITRADQTWGFPDMTRFPSGLDGERMHQLFGSLYVKTMDAMFRGANRRTWQDYRASGLFMSAVPAVLYSDIYGHEEYIRMMCTAAFGGLLWCPEVREAGSAEEFFHRLQTVILSPQALVNAWYLQYAPWLQFDRDRNNRGEFLPEAARYEACARTLIERRMALVPYLYGAFYRYREEGLPPFRPLVMDWPDDPATAAIDDQYMVGDRLMAAPLYGPGNSREVYFPAGAWYDFNTGARYEGGRSYRIETPLDGLPLYVREGTILPLAAPEPFIGPQTRFRLTCRLYGEPEGEALLLEDDGESYDFERGDFNLVRLRWDGRRVRLLREGGFEGRRYELERYERIR